MQLANAGWVVGLAGFIEAHIIARVDDAVGLREAVPHTAMANSFFGLPTADMRGTCPLFSAENVIAPSCFSSRCYPLRL